MAISNTVAKVTMILMLMLLMITYSSSCRFRNNYNSNNFICQNGPILSDIDNNKLKILIANGHEVDCINLISDCNSDHYSSDSNWLIFLRPVASYGVF